MTRNDIKANTRGTIFTRERARQLRDFSGLLYGAITPTDIDGLIEYHGKGYIFIETKLRDNILPEGQRLALERLTDDLNKNGKYAICLISYHEIDNPEEDIDVASTTVVEYRWHKKWQKPKDVCTTKDIIDWFVNFLDRRQKYDKRQNPDNRNAQY